MTPGSCFREYEKKMQIEEKCSKRTKPILTSVGDNDFTNSKLKFDNKVNKNLEQPSCLTSQRNVIQVNMIVTY